MNEQNHSPDSMGNNQWINIFFFYKKKSLTQTKTKQQANHCHRLYASKSDHNIGQVENQKDGSNRQHRFDQLSFSPKTSQSGVNKTIKEQTFKESSHQSQQKL